MPTRHEDRLAGGTKCPTAHAPKERTDERPNARLERDPEFAPLDEQLRQAMPVATPPDLANRVYRATVADLPEKQVVARLGWSSLSGWKYAAAIGLVFFYTAAWLKPYVSEVVIPEQEVAVVTKVVAEAPNHELDQEIDALTAEVNSLAASWDQPVLSGAYDGGSSRQLASDLMELEQQMQTEWF